MTPCISSSQYPNDQPPWSKPPLGSSSGPPGACMTPSRVANVFTMSSRIAVPFCAGSYDSQLVACSCRGLCLYQCVERAKQKSTSRSHTWACRSGSDHDQREHRCPVRGGVFTEMATASAITKGSLLCQDVFARGGF